jgi:hypothetical protein
MKQLLTRLAQHAVNWRIDWTVGLYDSMDGLEGSNGFVIRLATPYRLRRWLVRFIPTSHQLSRSEYDSISDVMFAALWLKPEWLDTKESK